MTEPRTGNRRSLLAFGGFFSFFLFGVIDNLKGPVLPVLLDEVGLDYAQGGTLILIVFFGFLVATATTGPLSDRSGNRILLVAACLLLAIGLTTFSVASAFWMLAAGFLIAGLGMGSLEVGGNLLIVELFPEKKARFLNLLAFSYGVGSMAIPLVAGMWLNGGHSWRGLYQWVVGAIVLFGLYMLWVPYRHLREEAKPRHTRQPFSLRLFSVEKSVFFTAQTLYVATEIGIASWLVTYLQEVAGFSVVKSTGYLSGFWALLTLGRLIGSVVVDRIGHRRSLLTSAILATLCIGCGLGTGPGSTLFLPVSGFFLAIIFPTVTAAVSDLQQENTGATLGLLFAFSGLGGMLGPWLVGFGSDLWGIQAGFALVMILSTSMILAFLFLRLRERRQLSTAR